MALIKVERASAKKTLQTLMNVHTATIRDIDNGRIFWKDGRDISQEVKRRCYQEIRACQQVHDAIDAMGAGHIARAVALCEQIKEQLPSVQ